MCQPLLTSGKSGSYICATEHLPSMWRLPTYARGISRQIVWNQQAYREPPVIPEKVYYYALEEVHKDVATLVRMPWVELKNSETSASAIHLGKLINNYLTVSVVIAPDMSTTVKVRDTIVHQTNVQEVGLKHVITLVDSMHLCPGVVDAALQGQPEVVHDLWYREVAVQDGTVQSSIRARKCAQFCSKPGICDACKQTRLMLVKRQRTGPTSIHPQAPLAKMGKTLLIQEISSLRKKQKELEAINKKIISESLSVSSKVHEELLQFYTKSSELRDKMDPFVRLFWEEQEKAFSRQNKGMRWHPMLIKFALMVRQQSPALYKTLREVGVLRLPGESTLKDYTAIISSAPGFQKHALHDLAEKSKKLTDCDKFVVLMHDEMKISKDLVFDRKTDQLIGYVTPEQFDANEKFEKNIADEVLLFLVVGVTADIHCSIGYFGTKSAKGGTLYKLLWDAVCYLEITCGLKVLASTSDKASSNMKLYQMHGQACDVVYKSDNIYASEPRCLYFISDVPHLIKTFRNNIYNSRKTNGKRLLKVADNFLTWDTLVDLWEKDISGPLYKTKLTYDHIFLTPQSMMKVRLAAQVLSESVGKVLQEYGSPEVMELSKVILLVDKFFDACNVRSHSEATRKRKPFCQPFTSADDERFEWFEKVFLQYFFDWEKKVKSTPRLKACEKSKMFLSRVTFQGLVMTVRSITEATKYLLSCGVKFVYTNRFCQDPVEEVFGRHRAMGRRSDNMNLAIFGKQERALHLQGQMQRQFKPEGNVTKKRHQPLDISEGKLPKVIRARKTPQKSN